LKNELSTSAAASRSLIFDGTALPKMGKTTEGVSKIYNHVSKTYYLSFKVLAAGYWSGSVFVPIDSNLHRGNEKSKLKYGQPKGRVRPIKKHQDTVKHLW